MIQNPFLFNKIIDSYLGSLSKLLFLCIKTEVAEKVVWELHYRRRRRRRRRRFGEMSKGVIPPWLLLLLLLLAQATLCSVQSVVMDHKGVFGQNRLEAEHGERKIFFSSSISTTQLDITTPTITPTTPTSSIPTPAAATTTTTSPVSSSSSGSWCVASQSASETAIQLALDYACGKGGADCSAIQAGGSCYNPNTVRDHASYAFNAYYQKNPLPTSCNFGGTAVIAASDPSSGTCRYPSTSTSATVLNTTIPSGSSTVFGSQPASSSSSTLSVAISSSRFFIAVCFFVLCYLPESSLKPFNYKCR